MFIKGNVKLCSGNRSFCRSVPKVKPLNQCGVIHPKPLLSCWKRNGNCTGKGEGQPRGEGSTQQWDGFGLSSCWPAKGPAPHEGKAWFHPWGCSFSAPFPSQAPLRTGVAVVMWPHGVTTMMMVMRPKRAHPGEGQTEVWVPSWDCCPLPRPA